MAMNAYKCTTCGLLHHPRHYICKGCGAREFQETTLEGEATVVTWTKVYNLPEGYMMPYLCFAIVRFENGLTVTGRINCDQPKTGMKVTSNIGMIKEGIGVDYYGFIFEPVFEPAA